MTEAEQLKCQADYEEWLRQGNAEALWSVSNPELIRQAFISGWRYGVTHMAVRLWAEAGGDRLTETMLAEIAASGQTGKPPGG